VEVIGENRVGQAIDAKHRGKEFETVTDPLAAMFVVIAAVFINATQKSLPNTVLNRMNNLNLIRVDVFTTRLPSLRFTSIPRKRDVMETSLRDSKGSGKFICGCPRSRVLLQREKLLEQMRRIELDGAYPQHHDSLTACHFSTEPA
jgi:hypothetical protein